MKKTLSLLSALAVCTSALNVPIFTTAAQSEDTVYPFTRIDAEAMSDANGISLNADGTAVTAISSGDWICFQNVDFGEGATTFTAKVASAANGGTIEIHLDSPIGPIVGVVTVPATGGVDQWQEASVYISGAADVHDLYFRFSGSGDSMFEFDSWQFDNREVASSRPNGNMLTPADDTSLLLHSTFEGSADNWTGRGDASVEASTKAALTGSGSLSCSGRAASWNGAAIELPSSFTAGTAYSFSANVMYEKGKNTDTYHLTLQYNSGGEAQYDKIATVTAVKGDWIQLANTSYTIPADATDMVLYVETETSTSAFYLDEVAIAAEGVSISSGASSSFVLGDANGNGFIDAGDLSLAKRGLLKEAFDTYRQEFASDVNQSGTVTIADVVWIHKFLMLGETVYPEKAAPENPTSVPDDFEYDPALQYKACPDYYFNPCDQAGTIKKESYNSINGQKSLWVYTPYGYDPSQQYNIFYLMHGGGENENLLFSDEVRLKEMLDHAIAEEKLNPLIVVTPTFNGGNCSAETFYQEFRASVVPFVESKYSTYAEDTTAEGIEASRMHRAYGGFSMGGVSTWAVMKNCLDMVGYFMPLSGDHWGANSAEAKAQDIANAINASGYEKDQYFIFAATGSDDIAYPNINPQIQAMKNMPQFIYTSDFSQGNLYFMVAPGLTHWWGYVRHYVIEALPYFFHNT